MPDKQKKPAKKPKVPLQFIVQAWLAEWNRRKSKNINGTTTLQTDYQMKFTIYKGSGADAADVVYLGSYVRDDFGDIRFTDSDGITLLDYWIESYISGTSATVWVKIPSIPASPDFTTIYLYYDNPTATTSSNIRSTFIVGDDFNGGTEQWTEYNSGATDHFIIDRTINKRLEYINLYRNDDSYVYLVKSIPNNFHYEFDFNQYRGEHNGVYVGLADSIGGELAIANGLYFRVHNQTEGFFGNIDHMTSGSRISASVGSLSNNVTYYVRFSRLGNTVEAKVWTNPARTGTPLRSGTYTDVSIASYYYVYAATNWRDNWGTGDADGFIDNIRIRKNVSPEPGYGAWGLEETQITCLPPACNLIIS